MPRTCTIVLLCLLAVGCSSPRTVDTGISILTPTITNPEPLTFHAYPSSSWEPAPAGAAENPSTAPNECDCPVGFTGVYNTHNWVCRRGTDAYFPHKDAFCNVAR